MSISKRDNKQQNAERFLISSVLRGGDFPVAIGQHVKAEMFHGFPDEWEWIEAYFKKYRKTPSKVAFKDKFPEFTVKVADDTAHFADEVKRSHTKSLMASSMSEASDMMLDGDIDGAVALMSGKIVTIASQIGTMNDVNIFSSFEKIFQDVSSRQERVEREGTSGVRTGFKKFDRITGGFQPGTFNVVAARLGEGKSWALQKIATEAVKGNKVVQFDALEQSVQEVSMRIHGMLSSDLRFSKKMFRSNDLMRGENFDLDEYRQFLHNLKKTLTGRLHVADTSGGKIGLMNVASQIERNNPDIVFIDYITLMQKTGSDWQDVAALSQGLKMLAVQYHIPIVVAAQLNRANGAGKGEPAGPEALAQSDAIGQDADVIITQRQQSTSTIVMKVAKNRNGKGGFKWHCEFRPDEGLFRAVSYERFKEIQDEDNVEAAKGGGDDNHEDDYDED